MLQSKIQKAAVLLTSYENRLNKKEEFPANAMNNSINNHFFGKSLFLLFNLLTMGNVFFMQDATSQGTWTRKANYTAAARGRSVGFSIGTKGYIGTGVNSTTEYADLWEYSPSSNSWTQMVNLNATQSKSWCSGFAIDCRRYSGVSGNAQLWGWTTDKFYNTFDYTGSNQ